MNMGSAQAATTTGSETTEMMTGPAPTNVNGAGMINQTIYDTDNAYAKYWETRTLITNVVDVLNPIVDLNLAAGAVLEKTGGPTMVGRSEDGGIIMMGEVSDISLWESLARVWANILLLIAMAVAAFACAYVKFMRLDVM